MHNYWDKLTRYTQAGDLPIDNNRWESALPLREFDSPVRNWSQKLGCSAIHQLVPTPARLFIRWWKQPKPMGWTHTLGCAASCATCPPHERSKKLKHFCHGICMPQIESSKWCAEKTGVRGSFMISHGRSHHRSSDVNELTSFENRKINFVMGAFYFFTAGCGILNI